MRFTNTVTVTRHPDAVFAFLARFENIPRWNYAISQTRKVSDGPVGVGSRYRQDRTVPVRSQQAFEVTEYAPDQTRSIQGTFGPFNGRLTYTLEPDGDATRIVNTADLEPTGPLRLVAPLAAARIRKAVAENLHALKELLERRSSPL